MSPVVSALKGYVEGSPITVTYYSFVHNFTDKRSGYTSYTDLLSRSIRCFKKIENVTIRISGSMDFGSNPENDENTYEGKGYVMGGMDARVGDIFLYEISPGHVGLFVVTDAQALAIHTGSFDDISFSLREYPSNETLLRLEDSVKEVYYYGELNGLTQKTVLLERQDYVNRTELLKYRKHLIEHYHSAHYDKMKMSYLRPDGVYDPYLTEFMIRSLSFNDTRYYPPMQLSPIEDFDRTIWSRLLVGKNPFKTLRTTFNKVTKSAGVMTVFVNGLINRQVVVLDYIDHYPELMGDLQEPYVFSPEFYTALAGTELPDTSSQLERLIYRYLTNSEVDYPVLARIHEYFATDMDEFYFIPLAIHLINKVT
jgi:hypothetical protein